jgi:hypothetical protein
VIKTHRYILQFETDLFPENTQRTHLELWPTYLLNTGKKGFFRHDYLQMMECKLGVVITSKIGIR